MSDKEFTFQPSQWVPFRDKEVIDRVAAIKREDMEKHPNPDYKIKVVPAPGPLRLEVEDLLLPHVAEAGHHGAHYDHDGDAKKNA